MSRCLFRQTIYIDFLISFLAVIQKKLGPDYLFHKKKSFSLIFCINLFAIYLLMQSCASFCQTSVIYSSSFTSKAIMSVCPNATHFASLSERFAQWCHHPIVWALVFFWRNCLQLFLMMLPDVILDCCLFTMRQVHVSMSFVCIFY